MIDRSTVFRQVRHDLFGRKDAQDASTLTYTWVAINSVMSPWASSPHYFYGRSSL